MTHRCELNLFRIALWVILTGLFPALVQAQLNESDTLRFQLRAGLSANRQTGNVDFGLIRGRLETVRSFSPKLVLKSQNNFLYQEFSGYKADNDWNSRNYLYFQPGKRIYPFLMGYVQTNFRRKIDWRYFAGGGATVQILRKKLGYWKVSLSTVYEETAFSVRTFNEVTYNGQSRIGIWRPTAFTACAVRLLNQALVCSFSAYWQPGIDKVPNNRAQAECMVEYAFRKRLSFSLQYLYQYEQVVASRIRQRDALLTLGLQFLFQSTKPA